MFMSLAALFFQWRSWPWSVSFMSAALRPFWRLRFPCWSGFRFMAVVMAILTVMAMMPRAPSFIILSSRFFPLLSLPFQSLLSQFGNIFFICSDHCLVVAVCCFDHIQQKPSVWLWLATWRSSQDIESFHGEMIQTELLLTCLVDMLSHPLDCTFCASPLLPWE